MLYSGSNRERGVIICVQKRTEHPVHQHGLIPIEVDQHLADLDHKEAFTVNGLGTQLDGLAEGCDGDDGYHGRWLTG
ncbi:hypothetical protein HOT75_gp057 [Gordonia phage Daredevil]|uniref:Uncharacterized protein n=1 Tax=Gordonia phage Daredevil TaxID=2283286 RepID=A0A345MIR3_9CAUD|nr:hypothetical protein HOT75_gp057 [Gordonia phage Daredevil]AXH70444.1 hypothetical protein SEA_DAREDEVIL_57 [Gordonia phage Daredevil]